MKYHSPIYDLLHQEIRECASHLLKIGHDKASEKSAKAMMSKLLELHQFASRVHQDERYLPLVELKMYLEQTMLCYQDDENLTQSMRLSEAIALLSTPVDMKFKPSIVSSLTQFFVRHFLKESKPGRPLHRKLSEIKKI